MNIRAGLHCCLISLFSGFIQATSAQPGTNLPHMVKAALVADTTAIVPGTPFTIALHIQHKKGWHTYWQNPGDVGIPPMLNWNLPAGWTIGEIAYQAPQKVKMFDITAHGFSGVDAFHLVDITPPADLPLTNRFELAANVTWMVCGTSCHPGTYRLETALPVASQAKPSSFAPYFARIRADHPRKSDAWQATAIKTDTHIILDLTPKGPEANRRVDTPMYYGLDKQVFSNRPHPVEQRGDGLRLTLPRSDYTKGDETELQAVLHAPESWLSDERLTYLHIHIPLKTP